MACCFLLTRDPVVKAAVDIGLVGNLYQGRLADSDRHRISLTSRRHHHLATFARFERGGQHWRCIINMVPLIVGKRSGKCLTLCQRERNGVFLPHSADFGKQLSGAVYRDFGQAIEVKKIPVINSAHLPTSWGNTSIIRVTCYSYPHTEQRLG